MDKRVAVRVNSPVVKNERISSDVFLLKLRGNFSAAPGQFYMLRAWELDPLLSRPMSVFDRTDGAITFLYQVCGRGTQRLSRLSPGDELVLFGPLGNGFELVEKQVALIGGGMGIAPLFYAAKRLDRPDIYLGFQDEPFLLERFSSVAGNLRISSEKEGRLVTDIFRPDGYDLCYACGPPAMLNTLYTICQAAGLPLFVSLEERMACGIGACLGCAVRTSTGIRRVCRDGPVFLASEVIWDG